MHIAVVFGVVYCAIFQTLFAGDLLDESMVVPRVLALLFLLSFENLGDADAKKSAVENRFEYSTALWSRIPVRFLLGVVEQRNADFSAVRAHLTK